MQMSTSGVEISTENWGTTRQGETAHLFKLVSPHLIAHVGDYGCIVQSLLVRDASGNWLDVALGFDTLAEYEASSPYFGATVGRVANRIAGAQFELDGVTHRLAETLDAVPSMRHLHGGPDGFDTRVWNTKILPSGLEFTLVSPDGDQGYPGELTATCRILIEDTTLRFEFEAETSAPTHVNLCHHGYFNLSGHGVGTTAGHELILHAERFLPVDAALIPTGDLAPVEGTCFDFRQGRTLSWPIEPIHSQLQLTRGHDHTWVLGGEPGVLRHAATLTSPEGFSMQVHTTEPGIQYYDGNSLMPGLVGKGGAIYQPHQGICLETQHFPDSPNQPHFPSTRLNPGDRYSSITEYRFS